jgi:16S rRNA processing protein RimM
MKPKLVSIAYVARAHGLRGELRLHVHNDETTALRRGARVVLRPRGGLEREVKLSSVRRADKAYLVTAEGVADRDAAEALKGADVLVPREALPPPEEGEFYACDVEGARAELVDGTPIGTVRELRSYPSVDVLVIDRPGAEELEVPLVEDYVAEVDPDAGLVKLHHVDEL